jgi:sugar phosphate isomerase/epimerase
MLNRRKFIARSATIIVAFPLAFKTFSTPVTKTLKNYGFISGIIGNELKGDWKAVLKKVASFGYTEIETGNYLGESAESYLKFLNKIGLKPVAGGINFTGSDEEIIKSFDLLKQLGIKIAVVYWPWFTGGPFNLEECTESALRLNYLGKLCYDNGLTFCWHNHEKEFIPMEKGLPFDFLMANTDPDLVKCEMDIYWVKKGGTDPLALLKKYRGRYSILHVKDMAPGNARDFDCPGSGIIDFAPIFREADSQGIKHYMVERDNVTDGIACLKSASEYLKNLTF